MSLQEPQPEIPGDDDPADLPERAERPGTLVRGLAVLEALTHALQPMSLAEIAAATGLEQSTTHRLLKVLDEQRYVVRIPGTRRYCASPRLLHPLPLLHPLDEARREAAPLLRDLALRLRLTTVFVIFVGSERLVLDVAQTPGSLTPYYSTWLEGPLHATGGGKSLLLGLDEAQRRALLGAGPFVAATPQTLTDWPGLSANLALAAERGYVVSRDEHRAGVTNIGAPITRWKGGSAGCLIATAHSTEIDDEGISGVGAELKRVAELLVYQAPSLEAASRFCGH